MDWMRMNGMELTTFHIGKDAHKSYIHTSNSLTTLGPFYKLKNMHLNCVSQCVHVLGADFPHFVDFFPFSSQYVPLSTNLLGYVQIWNEKYPKEIWILGSKCPLLIFLWFTSSVCTCISLCGLHIFKCKTFPWRRSKSPSQCHCYDKAQLFITMTFSKMSHNI